MLRLVLGSPFAFSDFFSQTIGVDKSWRLRRICGMTPRIKVLESTKLGMLQSERVEPRRRSFVRRYGNTIDRMRPIKNNFGVSLESFQRFSCRRIFRFFFVLPPPLSEHFSSNEACA